MKHYLLSFLIIFGVHKRIFNYNQRAETLTEIDNTCGIFGARVIMVLSLKSFTVIKKQIVVQ
ncbi:MAG: hypothetical protein U0T83_01765 [Bacteriovoracaceae bacterium]